MECYIAMARSKGGCSNLKGIFRGFFNATGEIIKMKVAYSLEIMATYRVKPVDLHLCHL